MTRSKLAACGLAVGLFALAGCASGPSTRSAAADPSPTGGPPAYTIATQATGRTNATPDTLSVTMGVETRDSSAQAALAANNDATAALINKLKSSGVAARDLQTVGLSIQPTYANNGTQITGYQVSNTVRVTFRDLKRAGTVIDAAAAAVGNAVRIQQMGFSLSDDSAAKAQARAKAVQQAQAQAEQIATASGAKLGRIRTIIEAPAQLYQPNYDIAASSPASASVPVMAGQVDLSVEIQIVYDIA